MGILHSPQRTDAPGEIRRVGAEFAFAGLDTEDAAKHIRILFGGDVNRLSPECTEIKDTVFGTFVVRRDAPVGQGAMGRNSYARTRPQTREVSAELASVMISDADRIAPVEISCPRIPYERLDALEILLDEVRRRGAAAGDSPVNYPVGIELEPEAASLETRGITAVLKAYLLMCDWLRKDTANDDTMSGLPVPGRFPMAYRLLVADPSYAPDSETLLRNYVVANPTRDRELDLYPLLFHVFGERQELCDAIGDSLSEPRPVYRYRLPHTALEHGGGRVTDQWNNWVLLERLADDHGRLDDMGRAFLARSGDFVRGDWADESERWLPR